QTETDVGNFVRYLVAERRGAERGSIEATNGQFVFTSRGHKTRIGNFPVGIDVAQFERLPPPAGRPRVILCPPPGAIRRKLAIPLSVSMPRTSSGSPAAR